MTKAKKELLQEMQELLQEMDESTLRIVKVFLNTL